MIALLIAAATTPAIAAFDEAFAKVNDYTVTIREFEAKGDRTQNRTYDFWFKRPNFIKTQITAGDGKGSGAVWNGGGYTIPEGSIQAQVRKYKEIKGRLTERKGPDINGAPTSEVELQYADPSSQGGATRAIMYFSSVTHFPLRQLQYEGDKIVGDESFADLKTNVGLRDSDFPF